MKKAIKILICIFAIPLIPFLLVGLMSGFVFDIREYTLGMSQLYLFTCLSVIIGCVLLMHDEFNR